MAEETAEKTRHEILSELWGVSVAEAKERDEARRKKVESPTASTPEGDPAPAAPVKKSDVVDKKA